MVKMMSLPATHRSSEVVVVKAKLKLMSLSGVVAALGVLVLLAGLLLAALGYWPRHGLFFSLRPQGGATTIASSTPTPSYVQVGGDSGATEQTGSVNETAGFLVHFLDRYLYSDRLKVLGPLVMGVGIFLFICANAVLHEERDRHTRVINLRDVYSTVIDLHRRPGAAHLATPPTNLVNYSQATSLESRAKSFPSSLQRRKEGGATGGGEGRGKSGEAEGGAGGLRGKRGRIGGAGGEVVEEGRERRGGGGRTEDAAAGVEQKEEGGEAVGGAAGRVSVFTVCQELPDAPPTSHSLSHLPAVPSPLEEELRTSFLPWPPSLPLSASCRRHSAGAAEESVTGRAARKQTCSCSSSPFHQEAPADSQRALLLLRSSLETPLSVSRRCSTPCTAEAHCHPFNSVTSSRHATSHRTC